MEQSSPTLTMEKEMGPVLHIFQFLAVPSQERSVQTLRSQFADVGVKNLSSHTVVGWQRDIVRVKVPQKPFPHSTALVSSLPLAFTFIFSLKALHLFSVMCQCGRAVPSREAALMPPPQAFTSTAVPTGHGAEAGVLMWDLSATSQVLSGLLDGHSMCFGEQYAYFSIFFQNRQLEPVSP